MSNPARMFATHAQHSVALFRNDDDKAACRYNQRLKCRVLHESPLETYVILDSTCLDSLLF